MSISSFLCFVFTETKGQVLEDTLRNGTKHEKCPVNKIYTTDNTEGEQYNMSSNVVDGVQSSKI